MRVLSAFSLITLCGLMSSDSYGGDQPLELRSWSIKGEPGGCCLTSNDDGFVFSGRGLTRFRFSDHSLEQFWRVPVGLKVRSVMFFPKWHQCLVSADGAKGLHIYLLSLQKDAVAETLTMFSEAGHDLVTSYELLSKDRVAVQLYSKGDWVELDNSGEIRALPYDFDYGFVTLNTQMGKCVLGDADRAMVLFDKDNTRHVLDLGVDLIGLVDAQASDDVINFTADCHVDGELSVREFVIKLEPGFPVRMLREVTRHAGGFSGITCPGQNGVHMVFDRFVGQDIGTEIRVYHGGRELFSYRDTPTVPSLIGHSVIDSNVLSTMWVSGRRVLWVQAPVK